ncbi:hypothetical protein ES702_07545 [subsurface metagenome]
MLSLIYYDERGIETKQVAENDPLVTRRIPSSWERWTYDFPEDITIAITPLKNGAKKVLIAKFDYDGSVDVIYKELLFARAKKENLGESRIVATSEMLLGSPAANPEEEIPVLQARYLTPLAGGLPLKELQVRNSEVDPEFCKIVKLNEREYTYNFCCSREETPLERYWNSPLIHLQVLGPYKYRVKVQKFENPGVAAAVGIRGDSRRYAIVGIFGHEHIGVEAKEVFTEAQFSPGRMTTRA